MQFEIFRCFSIVTAIVSPMSLVTIKAAQSFSRTLCSWSWSYGIFLSKNNRKPTEIKISYTRLAKTLTSPIEPPYSEENYYFVCEHVGKVRFVDNCVYSSVSSRTRRPKNLTSQCKAQKARGHNF